MLMWLILAVVAAAIIFYGGRIFMFTILVAVAAAVWSSGEWWGYPLAVAIAGGAFLVFVD